MLPLRILTLNASGLAAPGRRENLFRFLRTSTAHVACIQEVHANPDHVDQWTREWGGAASWNRYTAILLSPSLGSATFSVSFGGRVLATTFSFQGWSFTVCNIYAPADVPSQSTFFNDLSRSTLSSSSYDFLAGDWNSYPDPQRDRNSAVAYRRQLTWPRLLPFLESFYDAA